LRQHRSGVVQHAAIRKGEEVAREIRLQIEYDQVMTLPTSFDHCVVHVSDWERSNAFYRDVLGAELVQRPQGWAYRFGAVQLNLHGPGFHPAEVARLPVEPGNSDLCFRWNGPIADAIAHLERCRVPIHAGPMQRFGAQGSGTSVYFRDPDGSLLEFISYHPASGEHS
jgi:catechol 2,3-dioxygenase-like lactoylglutathione lyase family enzyme